MKNKLVAVICMQVNSDEEMLEFEGKITEKLNEGWRLVGPVQVDSSIRDSYSLVATLIKHPHFALNG